MSGNNPFIQFMLIRPLSIQRSHSPYRGRLFHAMPNVYNPYAANTLNPIGRGLPDLIARGIDEPASTIDASSASSTP